jgi:hypothetical protein
MRNPPALWFLGLCAALLGSACSDSTLPVPRGDSTVAATASGTQPRSAYTLPPLDVTVPRCDPTLEQSFCEDDGGGTCMTSAGEPQLGGVSTASSCGGPGAGTGDGGDGGGGGSGGSTGPGTACPDYGCEGPDPELDLSLDTQRDTIPPSDCSDPNNTHWEKLYCRSTVDSTQASKTRQALDRIGTRGAECAALAQKGRDMLAAGQLLFFTWTEGDAAGYGHPNTGIQIAAQMVAHYDPLQPDQDLEHTLVHELDHVFRRDHVDSAGMETPNTALCGG